MAKKEEAKSCACPVCNTNLCMVCSVVAVVVGILFLLQDLAIWNFWNINWYTVAFLMMGLGGVMGLFKSK